MPKTHQLTPRVFWHLMRLPRSVPLISRSTTQEIDDDFRHGPSLVLRVPFTERVFVLGRWSGRASDEQSALLSAIGGEEDTHTASEVREW